MNDKTFQWLNRLQPRQVRALGCQHKVEGWNVMPLAKLVDGLVVLPQVTDQANMFDEVELPETD